MKKRMPLAMVAITAMLVLLGNSSSWSDEIRTASPSWAKFTDQNGQGLYFDVLRAIFAPDTIRHSFVPAKRGLVMLQNGEADIYTCLSHEKPGLSLSSLPLYEGEFHAFFKNRGIVWSGPETIKNQRLVWRLGYYSPGEFPVPVHFRETRTAVDALKRVLHGGADFYIDDRNLIEEAIATNDEGLAIKDYRIESIGFRGYYPAFASTARGAALRDRYENGMRALAKSGKLLPFYQAWDLPMPRIYRE